MPEILFTAGTIKAALTLLILAGTVYGFVSEKVPPDVTALLALLALLLTGVLTPAEAFSGFSHPATVSVAAVLVLSAGIERTGALNFIARRVLEPLGKSELLLTAVVMGAIAALSMFINNTAAVAVFIPVVLEVCRRTGASPSRVLMPMSHAATFGGMCTLIGTTTNLVAHEFAHSQGLPGFSMFGLGRVGLPMLLAGSAYILFVGRWLLPRHQPAEPIFLQSAGDYLSELVVRPDSSWINREVSASHLRRDYDVELVGLMRAAQALSPDEPGLRYAAADSLRVRGPLERVLALAAQEGLEIHRPGECQAKAPSPSMPTPDSDTLKPSPAIPPEAAPAPLGPERLPLAEVVVLTTSGLIGQTLKAARFAEVYDAVVLALRRRGDLRDRPSATPLHAGDVLVVEGTMGALKALAEAPGFLVIGTPAQPEERPGKLVIAVLTLAAVITAASLGLLPIVTAATAGCAVLMLTGCLRLREAYHAINLSLVFLLAGALALGTALEKTGATEALANGLAGLTGLTGPFVVMAGFFAASVLISEFMSNSGTVALLAPVAVPSAVEMGINPMSLLAAITFGASASFAMPIGYQTSLMIYGPGGYRFKDFVRMGVPLDLLLALLALLLIPRFWPLRTP